MARPKPPSARLLELLGDPYMNDAVFQFRQNRENIVAWLNSSVAEIEEHVNRRDHAKGCTGKLVRVPSRAQKECADCDYVITDEAIAAGMT